MHQLSTPPNLLTVDIWSQLCPQNNSRHLEAGHQCIRSAFVSLIDSPSPCQPSYFVTMRVHLANPVCEFGSCAGGPRTLVQHGFGTTKHCHDQPYCTSVQLLISSITMTLPLCLTEYSITLTSKLRTKLKLFSCYLFIFIH